MLANLARLSACVAAIAVVLAIAGCQSGTGNRQPSDATSVSSDAQHEIPALLDRYTQALIKKDLATLDRIWADDLTFVNPRGELLTKQNRMDNIKTGATAFKSARVSEVRVRSFGEAAVATFQVALDAQYSGQEGSGNYRVTTAWARPKGAWQMVAVHMTRIGQ